MAKGLTYEAGRDMPPGMQYIMAMRNLAERRFLMDEIRAMLAVLQQVDMDCDFCTHATQDTPCADETVANDCAACTHKECPCADCRENSKYTWCGADEAFRRLAIMKK